MEALNTYHKHFENFLNEELSLKSYADTDIYEPINYMLEIGGKRIRPTALLLTLDAFGTDIQKGFWASAAIELFHNFSLIHDDIMDNSPLRRGKPTIHKKWDLNMAILSGDSCFALAYQCLENYDPIILKELFKMFTKASLLVCEGQRMDILFEQPQRQITLPMYLQMIELKTAVLLAFALKMGAVIAEKSKTSQEYIYEFGKNLGLAFQIQDDYLDLFGNQNLVGKEEGTDIINGKKTYLYLKALENSSPENKKELLYYFVQSDNEERKNNLPKIKDLFEQANVSATTKQAIEYYTNLAVSNLNSLDLIPEKKDIFQTFANYLMNRTY